MYYDDYNSSEMYDLYIRNLKEKVFQDAYIDAVCKFQKDTQYPFSLAESFAKVWATEFKQSEWDDPEIAKIADDLELSWKDCYAILGDEKNLEKELEKEKGDFLEKYERYDLDV